ncbi:MAG: DUF1858 domain-containing protein [Spirochaetes bacterium]|nr:DUF1858 domain-containing protein [Spirochaetota bacterium]
MITKTMTIGEAVKTVPESGAVMMKFGLHCIGCHVATWETIEEGCKGHGLSDEDIEAMLKEINALTAAKK